MKMRLKKFPMLPIEIKTDDNFKIKVIENWSKLAPELRKMSGT